MAFNLGWDSGTGYLTARGWESDIQGKFYAETILTVEPGAGGVVNRRLFTFGNRNGQKLEIVYYTPAQPNKPWGLDNFDRIIRVSFCDNMGEVIGSGTNYLSGAGNFALSNRDGYNSFTVKVGVECTGPGGVVNIFIDDVHCGTEPVPAEGYWIPSLASGQQVLEWADKSRLMNITDLNAGLNYDQGLPHTSISYSFNSPELLGLSLIHI